MRLLPILFLFFLSPWIQAQDIPDFSANYKVSIKGLSAGELKRSLITNADGSRTFNSQSQAKGVFAFFKPDLVAETSVLTIKNASIQPQSYLYERTGGKKEKYLSLVFDSSKKIINAKNKKQSWSLALEDNILDKLVYQLALMLDLEQNKPQLSYRIADEDKLKTYDIVNLGEEIISTPLGKINTIKLIRKRNDKKQRQTTLWCAPQLNYLPVKIEHIEKDGTNFTAELRRLKGIVTTDVFEKKSRMPVH